MIIPDTLSIESIDVGERGRTVYQRIEELAQSIHDNGLIQPLVLVPIECYDEKLGPYYKYGFDAGGRCFAALKLLQTKELYHATTSDPARPGYVLKGEDQGTPLRRLFTEIAENLDRDNLDWRDEMKLLTRAYRLAETEANAEGKHILMRDFGAMLGVGYADLQAATVIHDDVIKNPERYKDCNGIRAAYSVLLKCNAQELTKIAALKSMNTTPLMQKAPAQIVVTDDPQVLAQPEPEREITIPLSSNFYNHDALQFMYEMPHGQFDHVITDPDYAVSVELLESNMSNAAAGVVQESIEHSLSDMSTFIRLAFKVIKPQGFLVSSMTSITMRNYRRWQLKRGLQFNVGRSYGTKLTIVAMQPPLTTSARTSNTLWYAVSPQVSWLEHNSHRFILVRLDSLPKSWVTHLQSHLNFGNGYTVQFVSKARLYTTRLLAAAR